MTHAGRRNNRPAGRRGGRRAGRQVRHAAGRSTVSGAGLAVVVAVAAVVLGVGVGVRSIGSDPADAEPRPAGSAAGPARQLSGQLAGAGQPMPPARTARPTPSDAAGRRTATPGAATPGTATPVSSSPGGSVVLAFAGDVHFAGTSAAALDGGLGPAAEALRAADLAVVNLETAVTTGGDRQPKQYTFRAPAQAFSALADSGVDAVSMANNHGLDYGRAGLLDSLAAARAARVTVVGAGVDDVAAFAPLRRTIRGVRVSVFAVTDVLDAFAVTSWPAAPQRPGLASTKEDAGLARLADAVRAEKAGGAGRRADVVVVMAHWGVELQECPTARQQQVARVLAAAGADAVVGSHAHVLQPQVTLGRTLVAYGLGNFVFYAQRGRAVQSGVLTVTVTTTGVRDSGWAPAVIVAGRPTPLAGAAKADALQARQDLALAC